MKGDGAAWSARGLADRVEACGARQVRRRAQHVLEAAGGLLRLLDPLGRLGDAQGDELRAKLVEVAGERRLLGDLAERGDRDGVADLAAVADRLARVVHGEPGPAAVGSLERAEVDAATRRRLGCEDAGEPAVGARGGGRDSLEIVGEGHRARIGADVGQGPPRTRPLRTARADV